MRPKGEAGPVGIGPSATRSNAARRRFLWRVARGTAGVGGGVGLAVRAGTGGLGGARTLGFFGSGGSTALAGSAALAPRRTEAAGDAPVRLRELYEKDLSFSALARTLEGRRVGVRGYMAPPLKAESRFFVLTKRPMATCPFCNDAADWPDDIVAVLTKRVVDVLPFNAPVVARGRLELGDARDSDTGFFSRLRLVDAVAERV